MSMSLDGFVAGPSQSVERPLGEGGMRLHQWAFATESWRRQQGSALERARKAVCGKDVAIAGARVPSASTSRRDGSTSSTYKSSP
jgi:hypothetical protein